VQAVDEWNERTGTTLSIEQGDCSSSQRAGRIVWRVYEIAHTYAGNGGLPVLGHTEVKDNTIFVVSDRTEEQVRTDLLHEIGHSLGMQHLNVQTAIMYAFDKGQQHLTDDDVAEYFAR
jgi:hypothetical protein